ncbi:hypothetical protein HZY62_04840 [Maribacter polysiphoniae]|uniref:Uncharacterized protein n=1 Tax=Maribacter polysiphoniae TaxID=429344 RepID=A0A316E7K0_9FLAO|nr:hypothetical protein [Maribacter polysiphoniae]MBD1259904.1 hypothetical protein [Maribacter polysiphoniae]PWK25359.1 hypothetical protein LX92_00098 [Maribacter polysiphoniae]
MKTIELFKEDFIELFMPDGIEYISTILANIGYTYKNESSSSAKKHGLEVIEKLLELDLIEVFYWGKYDDKLKDLTFSNSEIINKIDSLWAVGMHGPDFYRMPMFKYKNWYLDALKKEGLTQTTNWKTFVKEKIGDLEKWIEENRPKNTNHNN